MMMTEESILYTLQVIIFLYTPIAEALPGIHNIIGDVVHCLREYILEENILNLLT